MFIAIATCDRAMRKEPLYYFLEAERRAYIYDSWGTNPTQVKVRNEAYALGRSWNPGRRVAKLRSKRG